MMQGEVSEFTQVSGRERKNFIAVFENCRKEITQRLLINLRFLYGYFILLLIGRWLSLESCLII